MIKRFDKPVYVTQPYLPPLEEYVEYLKVIWESKWVTNDGAYHQELEEKLCKYLGVKYISLFANGTLALITALQALRISGEVITTPFSFVATTHSIWWNNCKPVFVDIDPLYYNIDPDKIERAITPNTTAIVPVHVYGNPCKLEQLQSIASKYGLRLIYDAAHAFGVKINGNSVLNFGDISIISFHATKVYSTFEGGAIVCHDEFTKKRIDNLKNFGFMDETTVLIPGINAKMNEVQSAMGLLQLKYIDRIIEKRKKIALQYRSRLKNIDGIACLNDIEGVRHSYTYFPVLIDKDKFGKSREDVYNQLKTYNIFTRRYFFPLISQFPSYSGLASAESANLHVAEKVASQVLCLPIYPDLGINEIDRICELLICLK